jgi:hypothetical protein
MPTEESSCVLSDKSLPPPLVGGLLPLRGKANIYYRARLLLPGTFLMAVGAQLFAPFMLVNLALATFF